jgi:ABC-type multidrug transport system ATPase subunit/pSer/pThr/pTyr-binding forkhead associated (FHA) protein/ABC-type multidrug transport system permease subunit
VQWGTTTREFDQDRVVLGRDGDCDVVVDDARVSRHHLVFFRDGDVWVVSDASSNGSFVHGQRIQQFAVPPVSTVLNLGDPNGQAVTVWMVPAQVHAQPQVPAPPAPAPQQPTGDARTAPYGGVSERPVPVPGEGVAQPVLPPGQLAHGHTILPAGPNRGGSLSIGRELTNDVVLTDPLVSRFHARLDLGAVTVLRDLGSFNGTFVNGQRVQGSVALEPGYEVIFGNQTFRWDGSQLVASATKDEFTLYADGLTTMVAGGKILLDNVSLKLEPSSLTAVIGPSGAGKSTLLGALTGLRPATHGRVIWQGHDLYAHYDQLRFQIGLVPQQDIQHPQLKVKQALGYAAELRLPPDTTAQERMVRVQTVAQQLQLGERLDNRIGTQLSGGQRKRVSIATELLTAPPLLFLDEPTSGLDPGLDLEVMRQLRSLADDGRVVMVVTHSVLALDVCDNVMVLAPGGRIAYFGPPAGVLQHFGCSNYPEVFDLLDEPDLWRRIPVPARSVDTSQLAAVAAPVPAPPRQSFARQLTTLIRRNTSVVMADRLLLAMLVLLPLILGGLSRLVPGDRGLSLDEAARRVQAPDGGFTMVFNSEEARQRLIVLIVAACLMGTAMTIRELVGERPIFRREYAVGLSPSVYFLSKVVVLGTAAFLQGMLVTWIATVGLPGPDGDLGTLRVALVIGALSFTMAVIGLCLSALVTSTEQTMPALVGVIMIQLVLSGALFPIAGRPLLEQLAWLAPSRWAYAAIASTMGLVRAKKGSEDEDWIALAGADHYLMDMVMLGLLCALAFVIGLVLVRRSASQE